ncbi:hypothetical protein GALL_42720 [mine drainage metagenome]|uniref:Uncharacterized protein n=1 Tax=mine drainage metagenome TaxID=410659 RepID=A0A1J5T120_9ZZZZ
MNLLDLSAVQSFDKLVELLAIRLSPRASKSLVIRTNGVGVRSSFKNPFALSLMELLAIRLGCHKTPTKSLVMSKGELMQRADLKK